MIKFIIPTVIIFLIVLFWEKINTKIYKKFNIKINYIAAILLFLALITSTFVDKSRDDFKENTIPSFNEICYHNEASAYKEITNLGISELSVIVEKSYDLNLECWWKITRSNYSVNEPLKNVDQLIIFKKNMIP